MEAIRRLFAPEFRNRLDAVVQFAPLDERTIARVVDKLLVEVEAQLEARGVALHVEDDARRWIAERGYDPKMGARPMARLIQEHVKRPLAEELLFGRLEKGGRATVRTCLLTCATWPSQPREAPRTLVLDSIRRATSLVPRFSPSGPSVSTRLQVGHTVTRSSRAIC